MYIDEPLVPEPSYFKVEIVTEKPETNNQVWIKSW
jgi:hypothetical protein